MILTSILLLSIDGYSHVGQASTVSPTKETGRRILIKLNPKTSEYEMKEVSRGAVRFSAFVENRGDRAVIFAHPAICFPAEYRIGETLNLKDRHGRSEILLTIEKPDGQTIILRDGPHYFDPDNVSHFNIDPGKSKPFHIGWFFLNARGRWEDDLKAARVFMERGHYRIRLLYRNFFPKALVYDATTGKIRVLKAWTGEIVSNKVILRIK